jgi:hypothetical protein
MRNIAERLDCRHEWFIGIDRRLDEHEARLDSLVQTLGNLAADMAPPVRSTPLTLWRQAYIQLPERYETVIVSNGAELMLAFHSGDRWCRYSNGDEITAPKYWTPAPSVPEDD